MVAFIIFFSVATLIGSEDVTTTIAAVQPTLEDGSASPAAVAGIRAGDTILRIGGVEVDSWDSIVQDTTMDTTRIAATVRGGRHKFLTVTITSDDTDQDGACGILDCEEGNPFCVVDCTDGAHKLPGVSDKKQMDIKYTLL